MALNRSTPFHRQGHIQAFTVVSKTVSVISLIPLQPPHQIEARSEQEIFAALKLEYREPEERNA